MVPNAPYSAIRYQSLLTPSKIFSVLNKPSVLTQITQTSESRKHKSESNSTELPNEKRFKSSSSTPSTEPTPGTSSQTANERISSNTSSSTDVFKLETESTDEIIDQNLNNSTDANSSSDSIESRSMPTEPSPGPSSHRTLQKEGAPSAFSEPVKMKSLHEKRHRSSDDSASGNEETCSVTNNQDIGTKSKRSKSVTENIIEPSNESSVASGATDETHKPPDSPEQPREKRFKSCDSQEDTGASSNILSNSQSARTSLLSRTMGKCHFVDFNQLKPPPSYNSATTTTNSSKRQKKREKEQNSEDNREFSNDTRTYVFYQVYNCLGIGFYFE